MKILVIANTKGSLIFLKQYCDTLIAHSINLDVLDIWNFRFIEWSNYKKEKNIPHKKLLVNLYKLKHSFRAYFNNSFIRSLSKYDIVVMHYASPQRFLPIINELRKKTKIITLTIWGSDFYRRNKKKDPRYIKLLSSVDIIFTPAYGLNKDFISEFPSVMKKTRITLLGIGYLEIIKSLKDKGNQSDKKIVGYYNPKKRLTEELDTIFGEAIISEVHEDYRGLGILKQLNKYVLEWFYNNTDLAEMGT